MWRVPALSVLVLALGCHSGGSSKSDAGIPGTTPGGSGGASGAAGSTGALDTAGPPGPGPTVADAGSPADEPAPPGGDAGGGSGSDTAMPLCSSW